jgi:hypothetical protein
VPEKKKHHKRGVTCDTVILVQPQSLNYHHCHFFQPNCWWLFQKAALQRDRYYMSRKAASWVSVPLTCGYLSIATATLSCAAPTATAWDCCASICFCSKATYETCYVTQTMKSSRPLTCWYLSIATATPFCAAPTQSPYNAGEKFLFKK